MSEPEQDNPFAHLNHRATERAERTLKTNARGHSGLSAHHPTLACKSANSRHAVVGETIGYLAV
jgi:hypothetical protein